MSDLVISVNLDESRRRDRLVIETFEGTIPHLKSRQYSGPLRNTNVNSVEVADNVTRDELERIKKFLNASSNVQVKKHQYLLGGMSLSGLELLSSFGCLFYKQRKAPMFQVDEVVYGKISSDDVIKLQGLRIIGEKTRLYIELEDGASDSILLDVSACAYVDMEGTGHPLSLVFDYGEYRIGYGDNAAEARPDQKYRDYAFESKTVACLRTCHWRLCAPKVFSYSGKSFQKDLITLIETGIRVFTKNRMRVSKADYSNIRVTYGIDWFDVEGTVQVGGREIGLPSIINLASNGAQWVEVGESVIPVPEAIRSLTFEQGDNENVVHLAKTELINAVKIARDLNDSEVSGLEEFVSYHDVALSINERLYGLLRPYQEIGVRWLLSLRKNRFGGCLADDMGLGKTLQVIAYLSDSTLDGAHNLIIVPNTLLSNWEREFKKFLPEMSTYVYHGANRSFSQVMMCGTTITTYGTLLGDAELFCRYQFGNVVVDEAQFIKNRRSKTYRAIEMIPAETKILLTGTPVENNLEEYWGLMKLINPQVFKSDAPLDRVDDSVETMRSISAPFILRRMKEDVLPDLPEKREQTIFCSMGDSQRLLYDKMLESIRYEIKRPANGHEIKENTVVLKGLLYLQEICCHPLLLSDELNYNHCSESVKLELLMDMLEELRLCGHKVVVFSRFTRMLRIIERRLIADHFNYYYLDGKTVHRIELIEEFERSQSGVFLISLKAGGTGINLVSADTVIIYDPWWNPAAERQAEDRVFRIGQTRDVLIYRLIVEKSIEEKVQELQAKKTSLYEQLLDGRGQPVGITLEEMRSMIGE